MADHTATQTGESSALVPPANSPVLQRKCDCGTHTIAEAKCETCKAQAATGVIQRAATSSAPAEVPPIVENVLRSSGQPLDTSTRNFFEPRFGQDFSRVRVHTGQRAADSAAAISAHAYTVGENVVVANRNYPADTYENRRLMAHELAHVVQQKSTFVSTGDTKAISIGRSDDASEVAADRVADSVMNDNHAGTMTAARAQTTAIQRTVDDPKRYQETHTSLFVSAPGGGSGASLLPWEDPDPAKKIKGTADKLFKQAKANIEQHVIDNPDSVTGTVPVKTTETALDTDAVASAQALRARFPFMSISATNTEVESAVNLMSAVTGDQDYLREWLANKMPGWSDIEKFNISETDPRVTALLDRLLADSKVGPDIKIMASRQSGFQRGQGTKREIFVHEGVDKKMRKKVLFHELVHFHTHPIFREWVATTTNERWYNEGFTEYLARLAMPPEILAIAIAKKTYQDRVDSITKEVAAHVSDDDIARAFFKGEVWRIETRSKISRREVGAQLGLKETFTEKEEQEASRTGPGINQVVAEGERYRFMNLGFDQMKPKPEHVSFFKEVKTKHLDTTQSNGVVFEGHASTAGTLPYNLNLSLGRARAFYKMARDEGVASTRLIDAANPPHFGETKVTAEEEDPATRAFNRRVEMKIQPVASKPQKKD
jgi:outer membrane protein OmpA-like peptidoglycan-associated protein/Zn-dependent peptidase ImmA (M78 family)